MIKECKMSVLNEEDNNLNRVEVRLTVVLRHIANTTPRDTENGYMLLDLHLFSYSTNLVG